jgi:hypothetical protein
MPPGENLLGLKCRLHRPTLPHRPEGIWMTTGSPPTPPKARAGLLTPPGMSDWARVKISWLRVRFMLCRWSDV